MKNKLVKPALIYLFLKFHSAGRLTKDSPVFNSIKSLPGLRDKRTIDKHLEKLIELNWIGFDRKYGVYFIRSFNKIRLAHSFNKRQAATCHIHDLISGEAFFVGAILSKEINVQKFLKVLKDKLKQKEKKILRAAKKGNSEVVTNNSDVTSQPKKIPLNRLINHFGLSNAIIAELLGCKLTRACELKHLAAKHGYITVKHKFLDVGELPENDYKSLHYFKDLKGCKSGRFRFMERKKQKSFKIVEQLFDEIIPHVRIINIRKFSSARSAA